MSKNHSFHLSLAKTYWNNFLSKNDCVIDATCGNGHDTLTLAQAVLTDEGGHVFAYDIQRDALETTKKNLTAILSEEQLGRITLFNSSHENFVLIPDHFPIKLIVYNLGYLPGGDKSITTLSENTLASIKEALKKISPTGAISIMCYPGHDEGKKEEKILLDYLQTLASDRWQVLHHHQLNRPLSPSFIWVASKASRNSRATAEKLLSPISNEKTFSFSRREAP